MCQQAKNWKENAINRGDDEIVIRATATIDFICEVIMTIDNAPTVDCIEFNRAKELIKQAYQKGKDIRPQGEWKCPECGEGLFACPNCGADMRKGSEEE